ncbi:hypothetical protein [Rugamonas sp. DEMB1]|uniref:hypothetical protein n=1 Tax=Rugamonas sp. DEMB1 TaxID=3039386 RepID=UPI00244CB7AB|nr:hypothetical protein [Rugamonas sp. DEMB1]WGG50465.1 hypothetical protein QC826_29360 [Rugamonas sp. DEMB1]
MELSFDTLDIRDLCLNVQIAIEAVGQHDSFALLQRLADLAAAHDVAEYLDLFFEVSVSADDWELCIPLSSMALIVEQAHTKPPLDDSDQIDWSRVKRVKIVSLERIDD